MVAWSVISESVRGASHLRSGLPNQDAIKIELADTTNFPLIVAVADGHGSVKCTHSDLGSQFAVESAIEMVKQIYASPDLTLPQLRNLAENIPKAISRSWQEKVATHIERDAELHTVSANTYLAFGTTLLVACVLEKAILLWQIGDGDIVVIQNDSSIAMPIPVDERLLGNETTSLCKEKAFDDFRSAFLPIIENPPLAIFLASDGYKNSFTHPDGFNQALTDIYGYIKTEGADWVQQHLADWLNEASRDGSGDDISLAIIYHNE
jgi:serine/threonine protein phosphatase PrpC